MREPGQVADDRRHARTTPAPRRQESARGIRTAYRDRHLARQLEHVAVEQEEAGQAEPADDHELLVEPRARFGLGRAAAVALVEQGAAELGELVIGVSVVGPRIAVTEV